MNNSILQLQQQRMLLQIEYNHEKEEFRKQTETMGVERKVRRGDAGSLCRWGAVTTTRSIRWWWKYHGMKALT